MNLNASKASFLCKKNGKELWAIKNDVASKKNFSNFCVMDPPFLLYNFI